MTTVIKKYLDEIKMAVTQVAPDAEIILFGSQARGDARLDSDIDILVLIDRDKLAGTEVTEIMQPISDIEVKYRILINPIVRTRRQWFNRPFRTPFYVNVMNEGVWL